MPLLQLVQARDRTDPAVASIAQGDYAAEPFAVLEGQRPMRFSSSELCWLSSVALDRGFRLVDVELARPGHGPMPDQSQELEAQLVTGIRESNWRQVQRALELVPDEFFIEWVELSDRETGSRVRLNRYGVVNIPVADEMWPELASRIETLISQPPQGTGVVPA
jgi:hypothetical protein